MSATLVTGASGFVGSALVRKLIAAGHQVRVLLRLASNRRNIEGLPVEVAPGDLADRRSLESALEGCSALFHAAADYRLWARRPQQIYQSNVAGTVNIMQAALKAGVTRVVYTSSVATLGLHPDGSPADEKTPVTLADMIGDYKRSKYLAEAEVKRMIAEQGLPAVIVNPSTPVGPRDIRPTPTGRMVLDAACGRTPAYVDTGLNLVHVDDVAQGHLLAFERGVMGERYILGGRNMTLQEILIEVARISGQKPPRVRLPHNLVLPVAYISEAWAWLTNGPEPRATVDGVRLSRKYMYFSSEKARRELGYSPRPVEEALQDAVEWFRANGYCRS
ncbi:MAG TPA: hopanoid-associated sugar epimerase [Burkholderiales bacterium]|nr:hopanoid-associated sugar epimerase [Burkholderiales bacterium]